MGDADRWYERPFEFDVLERAVALDQPYRLRNGRETPELHAASVLILFSPQGQEVLLTLRTETVESHKGQYAFPGGRREPGETPRDTALRETFEEVGIAADLIRIAGHLPELLTVTGYRVTPFLGMLTRPRDQVALLAQESETAEVFWAATRELFHPQAYREERVEYKGLLHPVDAFYSGERRIWGATAAMLGNTAGRLAAVLRKETP